MDRPGDRRSPQASTDTRSASPRALLRRLQSRQLADGNSTFGMSRNLGFVFGDRALPISASLADLAQNEMETGRKWSPLQSSLRIFRGRNKFLLLQLCQGQVNELIRVLVIDLDCALQIILRIRKSAGPVVGIAQAVI